MLKINGFHSDVEPSTNKHHRDSKFPIQKGPYLIGATLGEGAFAKVKEAIHSQINEKVAIKIMDKTKMLIMHFLRLLCYI